MKYRKYRGIEKRQAVEIRHSAGKSGVVTGSRCAHAPSIDPTQRKPYRSMRGRLVLPACRRLWILEMGVETYGICSLVVGGRPLAMNYSGQTTWEVFDETGEMSPCS